MHVLIGKRQIVLAALVVMLGLAVFVNWYYTGSGTQLFPEGTAEKQSADVPDGAAAFTSAEDEADYFAAVRLNREVTLSNAIEELEAVMASADAEEADIAGVSEQIAALTAAAKMESDIENLVTAQLGGNCVAVASGSSLDVIVSKATLSDSAVLQISDIIRSVCSDRFENVRIAAALS